MLIKQKSKHEYHEPFHYRYRTFFVGLFILVPLICLLTLSFFYIFKSGVMEKRVTLISRYSDIYSLQKDAAVIFRGFQIGKVKNMELSEKGYVAVTLSIKKKYFPLIQQNCRAHLLQKNFPIGDWQIHVKKDDTVDWKLTEGSIIPSQNPISLDSVLLKVEGLMTTVETINEQIQKGEGLLGALFSEETILTEIHAMKGRIITLLNEVDRLLSRADNTVSNADAMIVHMDEFGQQGTVTVKSFQNVIDDAGHLVGKFDSIAATVDTLISELENVPPQIDTLLQTVKKDLDEAEILILGLQKHWLLKKAVNKAKKEAEQKQEQ